MKPGKFYDIIKLEVLYLIFALPDLHCYWTTYEKNRQGEKPSRLSEWEMVADKIVEYAKFYKPTHVIAPGDLYRDSKPESEAVNAVLKLFKELDSLDCQVIAFNGNHDFTSPGKENFVDTLAKYNPNWGITSPTVIQSKGLSFAILPWNKMNQGQLLNVLDTLNEQSSNDTIFAGHWATDKSVYANGAKVREVCIPVSKLKETKFQTCILGHIHKPQLVSEWPLIFHPGVMTRGKSDEGKFSCGLYIIEPRAGNFEFVELPAKDIISIELSDPIGEWWKDIGDLSNSMVVAKYEIDQDDAAKVDNNSIIEGLYNLGASYVEGVHPHIIRKQRTHQMVVNEEMTEKQFFASWFHEQYNEAPPQYMLNIFDEYLNRVR